MSKRRTKPKRVGNIGNYYGGLYVFKRAERFYWYIEDWDGTPCPADAEEIPEALYRALLKMKYVDDSPSHEGQ